MKILILTPLFPPDTGAPAPYTKQLIEQLQNHQVTLVAYGHLPEAAPYQTLITLDKRWPKLFLLMKSFFVLLTNSRSHELILVNNGPSTELPALAASFFIRTPIKLCLSDPRALRASEGGLYKIIHTLFRRRASSVITFPEASTYLRPEKLPFAKEDPLIEKTQQAWWQDHITTLIQES